MLFTSNTYIVEKNEATSFPVGTPKIIRQLKKGDELYFTIDTWGSSSYADDVQIHHVTEGTSHKMKKGNFFNAIRKIQLKEK